MNFGKLLTNNREKIISTCGKYGAQNVRVFGSVARGEADDKSDIDLLVNLSRSFGLFELVDLEEELSTLLGRKVDVFSDRIQRPTLRERILKDARPL
jgi:uncharacterized protein